MPYIKHGGRATLRMNNTVDAHTPIATTVVALISAIKLEALNIAALISLVARNGIRPTTVMHRENTKTATATIRYERQLCRRKISIAFDFNRNIAQGSGEICR
jgi:hypothetical protein